MQNRKDQPQTKSDLVLGPAQTQNEKVEDRSTMSAMRYTSGPLAHKTKREYISTRHNKPDVLYMMDQSKGKLIVWLFVIIFRSLSEFIPLIRNPKEIRTTVPLVLILRLGRT